MGENEVLEKDIVYQKLLLSTISTVIDQIQSLHIEFNSHFFSEWNGKEKFNLKTNCVKHLFCPIERRTIHNQLRDYFIEYRRYLSEYDTQLPLKKHLDEVVLENPERFSPVMCEILKSRVKQQSSVQDKWAKYACEEKHQFGNTPLKKCINDINGYRFLVHDREELVEAIKELVDLKKQDNREKKLKNNLRLLDATKAEGYKATHIYFYEGNYALPWELQIWDVNDFSMNQESHRIHKQDYIPKLEPSEEWEL